MRKAERSVSKQGHLACIQRPGENTTVKWPIINTENTLTLLSAVSVAAASAPSDWTASAVVALEVEAAVSAPLFSKQRFDFLAGSSTSLCTEQLLLACPDPSLAVSEDRFRFLEVLLDKLLSTGDNKSVIKKLI